jgi:undecaprenyl diphosphate synthase
MNDYEAKVSLISEFSIQNLGIIMDGNRRWAKMHGLSKKEAYARGADKFCEAILACIERKTPHLTVYALSLDNFNKRSTLEIEELYLAIEIFLDLKKEWLIKQSVKIEFVGNLDIFPTNVLNKMNEMVELTKNNDILFVHLLFGFGFNDDILHAVRHIAEEYKNNKIELKDIKESYFYSALCSKNIPPVDLVIRTGGYERLSGFVPLQSAWADFVSLDILWPDISKDEINKILNKSFSDVRNFGA